MAIIIREQLKRKLDDYTERNFIIAGRTVPGHKIQRYVRMNMIRQISPSAVVCSIPMDQDAEDDVQSNATGEDTLCNIEARSDTLRYVPCSVPLQPSFSREIDIYNFAIFTTELFYYDKSYLQQTTAFNKEEQVVWILERTCQILRESHDRWSMQEFGRCVLAKKCTSHFCHVIMKFREMSWEEIQEQIKITFKSRRMDNMGLWVYDFGSCSIDYAAFSLRNTIAMGQNRTNAWLNDATFPPLENLPQQTTLPTNTESVTHHTHNVRPPVSFRCFSRCSLTVP